MNTPSSQAVTTLMQQAALNLRVGQHDAARKCYLEVLTLVPDHADAMANLSKLAMHEGRPDEALSWLEKVILQMPSSSLHLEMGRQYQILNQLEDAIRHARAAIDLSPQNIIAYELLGDACFALDRLPEAVAAFRQALELSPRDAALHGKLGCVFFQLQDADNAIASLSQAISLQPDLANAYLNRGTIYLNLGQSALGLADMESAIRHDPSLIDAHLNIAMEMHAQNRRAESAAALRRVIALDPQNAFAFNGLANQLHALNENSEAEACFRQATTLNPEYTEAFCDWGDHLLSLDRNAEAAACYQRALALAPDHIRANFHLGIAHYELDQLSEAAGRLERTLSLDPEMIPAHVKLAAVYHGLGRYAEERAEYQRALELDPTNMQSWTGILFALSDDPACIPEQYLREAARFGDMLRGITTPYADWPGLRGWQPGQPLRVGLVSGDLRLHPVGYFLENVLKNLNKSHIELYAYNVIKGYDDALTERLKPHFVKWQSLPMLEINDEEAARQIHGDNLHILIDLSGHTRFNRLATFAMRPAPVQISWLGYFASTGVPGMDYLIADPVSVPEAHRAHFTEEILYLPDTRLCFTPQPVALTLEPASAPVLDNGYITFGCFQNLRKLNDRVLALWSRVLAEVPGSRMLFKNKQIEVEATRQTFLKRLADAGIARERIVMEGQSDYKDYLEAYGDVDLVLDTLPFPGGTTTCEALWMGVPTVTLAGDRMIGLQGASMLSCVGLHDWIAHSEDEFVAIAVAKAADSAGLAALRGELRQRMASSALVDAQRFARQFEVLLDEVWQRRLAAG